MLTGLVLTTCIAAVTPNCHITIVKAIQEPQHTIVLDMTDTVNSLLPLANGNHPLDGTIETGLLGPDVAHARGIIK